MVIKLDAQDHKILAELTRNARVPIAELARRVGLSVGDTTLGTLVANLGYDKLVMPKPVFIGDTLRARLARAHEGAVQIPHQPEALP